MPGMSLSAGVRSFAKTRVFLGFEGSSSVPGSPSAVAGVLCLLCLVFLGLVVGSTAPVDGPLPCLLQVVLSSFLLCSTAAVESLLCLGGLVSPTPVSPSDVGKLVFIRDRL